MVAQARSAIGARGPDKLNVVAQTAPAVTDPRLTHWEQRTRWVIVLAALIPLFGALGGSDSVDRGQLGIDIVAWVVFAVDLAVHLRLRRHYLRTWQGTIDLGIVLLTFPWYIIPGFSAAQILVAVRLARLARVVALVVKGGIAHVFFRLGKTAVFAVALVLASAIVVRRVEPPSSGFDSLGDAVWWAVVTITTVGYGDLVPVTTEGRIAAGILMVGGLAVFGSIAATLAAYLNLQEQSRGAPEGREVTVETLLEEVQHIHRKVDTLTAGQSPDAPDQGGAD